MPNKTGIEWTDWSSNPIRARDKATGKAGHHCEKLSTGCAHCYSEVLDFRFGIGLGYKRQVTDLVEIILVEAELQALIQLNRRLVKRGETARVFLGDMTDLFGHWVPDWMLDRIFAVMALTPNLTYQMLTKRAERMADYMVTLHRPHDDRQAWDAVRAVGALEKLHRGGDDTIHDRIADFGVAVRAGLPNVWLGVSTENQETADERIPHLLRCPAAVRFLSCEPLLGAIDLRQLRCGHLFDREGATYYDSLKGYSFWGGTGDFGIWGPSIGWVIIGGESGAKARPFDIQWGIDLIGQCQSAGVPVFMKQAGSQPFDSAHRISIDGPDSHSVACDYRHKKGADPAEWPVAMRVREFPTLAGVAS